MIIIFYCLSLTPENLKKFIFKFPKWLTLLIHCHLCFLGHLPYASLARKNLHCWKMNEESSFYWSLSYYLKIRKTPYRWNRHLPRYCWINCQYWKKSIGQYFSNQKLLLSNCLIHNRWQIELESYRKMAQ
jgi:hypothetical protein